MLVAWYAARRLFRFCERNQGADWGGKWLNRLDGLNRFFCRWYHRLEADPVDLPATGPAVVVANHLSGLDPLLMVAACDRPLRFMIARKEYDRWWLRWLFDWIKVIPVERSTSPTTALYAARRALDAGEVVALFPQGRIHLDHEPVRPKRGSVLLATLTGAPIVPLRIDGVSAQGETVAAVFKRSRTRIRAFPPLQCTPETTDAVLARLAANLSPTADGSRG